MPELPEVENVVRGLSYLSGKRLRSLEIFDSRVWFESPLSSKKLTGIKLLEVARRGKYILLRFEKGFTLIQHLRMTGKMLESTNPGIPNHIREALGASGKGLQIRCRFIFEREEIWFYDTRRFGTLTLVNDEAAYFQKKSIAPDPFHDPLKAYEQFKNGLSKSKKPIKSALLDQSIVAGVGNIYADEALHLMRIHPQKMASQVTDIKKLWKEIISLLERSIESGGSTIRNYVNSSGEKGSFAQEHLVYGKTGSACPSCQTSISRIIVGGRATHFCRSCQPKKQIQGI